MGFQKMRAERELREKLKNKENRRHNRYPVVAGVRLSCEGVEVACSTQNLAPEGFSTNKKVKPQFGNKIFEFELSYQTTAGKLIKSSGKARLLEGSLNRFVLTSGRLDVFLSAMDENSAWSNSKSAA